MVKRAKTRQRAIFTSPTGVRSTPELDRLVQETVGRVADKWTLLVLQVLGQHEVLRFGQLADLVGDISQKMLTKTLRAMEKDGFVTRTIHAEVPPRVEYRLTKLGYSLGEAFCAVWIWAEKHQAELMRVRAVRDK